MNIAAYVDCEFEDEEAFSQFSFIHFIAHDTISAYIEDQNLAITNYPLENPEQQKDWLFTHNRAHMIIAQQLGLSAPQDMELYDLQDEHQFYDWMAIHGGEHDRILLAMGF